MSDYGDENYSDYEDDFFWVEDEYMVADDLAEHVVNSPPPTAYADEDVLSDWDRFEYYNDLEYASDGYDDGKFYLHGQETEIAQTGQKRKRGAEPVHRARKKQRIENGRRNSQPGTVMPIIQPIVWRRKVDEKNKAKLFDESQEEPYALLKDWRDRLTETPAWAAGAPPSPGSKDPKAGKQKADLASQPAFPTAEPDGEEEEEDAAIDPDVLMAALQKNLAAAGGPLSGMDPQQLLQFAMRMMTDEGAGDEIAGELAANMLEQGGDGDDEEDEEAPADLLSWLSKQRGSTLEDSTDDPTPSSRTLSAPKSPDVAIGAAQPLTPPSSEANRSIRAAEELVDTTKPKGKNPDALKQNSTADKVADGAFSRKRKADDEQDTAGVGSSTTVSKKRATRSYDAPTASSQARATRRGRTKHS
ncbi:hypothetical protein BCR34DRAFT_624070 [Clohesyomyces aquaticus]|uniref:Uncharacterized protein n=1 Tax=Clohesyomyces aquaticus TaxID=1231657 RepID=A0A1Y1ZRU2_9PLEO|nr:hypothetical protein BCR34DRAFT_624070 [Clohesyomyces aquaticus]